MRSLTVTAPRLSVNRIAASAMGFVLLAGVATTGLAQPGDGALDANTFKVEEPTVLGVGADENSDFKPESTFERNLKLDDDLANFLTADGLNWNLSDVLKDFRLDPKFPEKSARKPLRVGEVGAPDIDIGIDFSPEPIKLSDPVVRMTLRAIRPETIPIGVYSANLPIRFTNPKLEPKSGFVLSIPIVLYSFGRILEEPRFLSDVVRVGAPGSVEIRVVTIGDKPSLGTGELRVNYSPPVGKTEPGVRLRLPLPDKEPIVPLYDMRFGAASERSVPFEEVEATTDEVDSAEFWIHQRWRDGALWQREKIESVGKSGNLVLPPGLVNRHTIEIHLPDVFSLGGLKADIDWDPGRKSHGENPAKLTSHVEAPIKPGLLIQHHAGFIGDRLKLMAVAAKEAGDELTATVTGPDKQSANIVLTRRVPRDDGKSSLLWTTYVGEYPDRKTKGPSIDRAGGYSIQIVGPEDIDASLKLPVNYDACFRINTRKMERHRALTIFASAIPLDEWLNKNPDISWNKDKICWNTELKDAFGVSFSNEELEDAKIRSLTTYRMNGSRPQPILRPNEEIELKFTTEAESTDSGSIVLPADRYLPYTILASISDKDPPDAPRRQLGTRQFRHLLLLTGKDAYGNYHTRTWYVPLRVRIDTDFEHYKWFYLLLAVVGVVALAAGIHWLCKTKGTVAPIAETQLAVTAADDFFSDSPAATIQSKTSSATTSPSKIAKPPVKPQEASEPPAVKPTDDWENW